MFATRSGSKADRAATLLARTGTGRLLRRLPTWSGLLTLCFHRIGDGAGSTWERSLWDATIEQFDRSLRLLVREADVIAPGDVIGLEDIPRGRHVLLTFDDGYKEWANEVLDVLVGRGVTAAFFVSTGFIDRPRAPWWYEIAWMTRNSRRRELAAGEWLDRPLALDGAAVEQAIDSLLDIYKRLPGDQTEGFLDWLAASSGSGRCDAGAAAGAWLDWPQIRRLRDAGMEIGGHTVDHPILARLAPSEQHRQVLDCADRIRAETGRPMRMFTYPVGLPESYGSHARAAVSAAGASVAFGYDGGFARSGEPFDPLNLPRTTGGMSLEMLGATLALPGKFARW